MEKEKKRNILENFYEGEIHPYEPDYLDSEEYKECSRAISAAEETLRKKVMHTADMSKDEINVYIDTLSEAHMSMGSFETRQNFVKGYKMAVKMMTEALS